MEKQLIFQMEEKYQDYLSDESKYRGSAESISFPTSEEEIIEIVEKMRTSNTPITIQGGKTGIVGGAVPNSGHIINLSRMNRVLDSYERDGEYFIVVEPGITLMDLNQEIVRRFKGEHLFWAPSPTETTATVGGVAATGAKGINAIYYGDSRKYIQAVHLVKSSGEVCSIERKNLLDSNLDHVLGIEGIAGVFSQLTLRLVKKPENIWGITFFFQEEQSLFEFAETLCYNDMVTDGAEVVAMEYLDQATIKEIETRKQNMAKIREVPDIDPEYCGVMYMEIQGIEEDIESMTETIMEYAAESGCDLDTAWAVSGEMEIEKMRAYRHAAAEVMNLHIEEKRRAYPQMTKLATDISYTHRRFSDTVKKYKQEMQDCNLRGTVFGHVKDNHLHVNILPDNQQEYEAGIAILQNWTKEALEQGERVVTEHGIGKLKKQLYGNLVSDELRTIYEEIKKQYDAEGMWNQGNIL